MLRFTLLASLALGTATANSTNRTATALQSPLQTRRFGVQVHCDGMTHCSNPPMPDICAAAQVTRNGAWWRYVEKVKGQYYFGNMEAWVAHANSCNSTRNGSVGINFVLNGGNHLYGGKDSDSPKTSAQIQGYTNFVVAVASHFAGKGIIWELYNEPDLSVRKMTAAQYATLVISVGKAIRANPRTRAEILMVSCAPRPSACWSFTCNPLLVSRVSRTCAPAHSRLHPPITWSLTFPYPVHLPPHPRGPPSRRCLAPT